MKKTETEHSPENMNCIFLFLGFLTIICGASAPVLHFLYKNPAVLETFLAKILK